MPDLAVVARALPSCRCRGRSPSPRAGRSTRNAELRACGGSASGSVRAMRIAKRAPLAPEMNHLWPLITQSSPSFTARVWISVGSEPETSGSVMAKHERERPSASGRRYFSFCAGVAACSSVCMLPSSGACALRMYGPMPVRPASAETNAIATGPRPMPSHSVGRCGFHSPRSCARCRKPDDRRRCSRCGQLRRRVASPLSGAPLRP